MPCLLLKTVVPCSFIPHAFFLVQSTWSSKQMASEKGTRGFWLWEIKIGDEAGICAVRKVGEGSKAQMPRTCVSGAAPIVEHLHLLRCSGLKDVVMN